MRAEGVGSVLLDARDFQVLEAATELGATPYTTTNQEQRGRMPEVPRISILRDWDPCVVTTALQELQIPVELQSTRDSDRGMCAMVNHVSDWKRDTDSLHYFDCSAMRDSEIISRSLMIVSNFSLVEYTSSIWRLKFSSSLVGLDMARSFRVLQPCATRRGEPLAVSRGDSVHLGSSSRRMWIE